MEILRHSSLIHANKNHPTSTADAIIPFQQLLREISWNFLQYNNNQFILSRVLLFSNLNRLQVKHLAPYFVSSTIAHLLCNVYVLFCEK